MEKKGLHRWRLRDAINVFNINGMLNTAGSIPEFVRMAVIVDGYKHTVDFLITDLEGEDIILRLP